MIKWWKTKVDEIYGAVPDLGGIVLKADSEGRVGPSAYKRTHADAANVIARALKPHGGVFFYRGFVYDHKMDWRNLKNDRARAAYDNFIGLDGRFDDNVIIQIKHGPIDFQVREPASPLFGALKNTNEAVELQITQEYFGQGRHTVFLVPMWKEALDFDMKVRSATPTPVKAIVSGKVWKNATGGFVGVSNVGRDANWFGNHMSQANLYGFGRLAWDADLSSKQIIDDWTRLTFGTDSRVVDTVNDIQLKSWRVFENYTGPLGLQTLTDIVGNHYGVSVEASERNGWGQWHRADENGVGMDRTVKTGTGYIGQYSDGGGRRLRVAQLDAGRSRAVHAPPAVHLPAEVGEDRHPIPLRLALRGRRRGRRLGAQLEAAGGEGGRGALRRHPETARVPGGPGGGLARRRGAVVPPHVEDPGQQGTRRDLSRANGGGGGGARRLHRRTGHAVGSGLGRRRRRVQGAEMHRDVQVRGLRRPLRRHRAVLRRQRRGGAL